MKWVYLVGALSQPSIIGTNMNFKVLPVLLLLAGFASANQGQETGKITKLLVHNNPSGDSISQRVVIFLDGQMNGGFCNRKDWSFVLKNDAARAQYSLLLASKMADREVKIVGNLSQDCIADYENVRNVEIL